MITRALVAAGLVVAVVLTVSTGRAEAGWSTGGAGTVASTSQVVPAGGMPSVTMFGRFGVLTWPTTAMPGGTPTATGYVVHRVNTVTSSSVQVCSTTITICLDASVPDGSWQYRVQARLGAWIGAFGPPSATVVLGPAALATPLALADPAPALVADPAPAAVLVDPLADPAPAFAVTDPLPDAVPAVVAPDPAVTDPAAPDPAVIDPAAPDPGVTDPAVTDPAVTDPAPALVVDPLPDPVPAAAPDASVDPSTALVSDVVVAAASVVTVDPAPVPLADTGPPVVVLTDRILTPVLSDAASSGPLEPPSATVGVAASATAPSSVAAAAPIPTSDAPTVAPALVAPPIGAG